MKILSISSILPVPGITRENSFVFDTYKYLLQGYPQDQVRIIKPFRLNTNPKTLLDGSNPYKRLRKGRHFEIEGFPVETMPFLSAWRQRNIHAFFCHSLFLFNRKRIRRLLKSFTPDVIHAQFILPDGLLAMKLSKDLGIPYLLTTHNERFYFDHAYSRRKALKVLEQASALLPINHFNYSYFRSIDIRNLHLSPLGFDRFFLKEQKKSPGEKIRIITVSVLVKLKNIDQVIRAVKELVIKHQVEYIIVGDGPERQALEQLVRELDLNEHVTLAGSKNREEVAEAMYESDIFIMPSFFETFGRVYFEAMAMGIPVICARNSGIFGMFEEGREGFSVNHEDLNEITEVLEKLILDPELRMRVGKNGQELVRRYSWEQVANDLREHYSLALGT